MADTPHPDAPASDADFLPHDLRQIAEGLDVEAADRGRPCSESQVVRRAADEIEQRRECEQECHRLLKHRSERMIEHRNRVAWLEDVIRRAYQGDPDDLQAEGEKLCADAASETPPP